MNDETIQLGPIRAEDSAILWQWINARPLVVLSSSYRPVHESSHQEWFANMQRQRDCVFFAIRLAPADVLVGTCQLHKVQPVHRSAELQIRIGHPDSRGKGYGTQALRQLLKFGFQDLNLNRIHLHVLPGNRPALRLYERCQFQREGRLRSAVFIDGEYQDVILMSLLRDEYLASREETASGGEA
jgi:RimJ/RimL family protein N-acetyltransferase